MHLPRNEPDLRFCQLPFAMFPPPAVHEFQEADGDLEERMVFREYRLGQRNSDHHNGRLRPSGRVRGYVGSLRSAVTLGDRC